MYGYATGVFSSRKLERATYDFVAFRFIAANDHPDHDTIAAFRRRFLKDIETLFVQVLLLAREMGMLQLGMVALDGTKVHANASKHSALSYEHAGKIEAQLKAEVAELMAKAEAADKADLPDGMSIPDELARREERLKKIAEARTKIEARAKERFEREQAEYQAKLAAREAKTKTTGNKPGGKPPQPPVEGPLPTDQINLTDEELRIMPVSGGGFEQCYNAQAVVAQGSLLVVAGDVVQSPNDKQQLEPMLAKTCALSKELGKVETLLGDNGYFSEANVKACKAAAIEPLLAMGRDCASSILERALRCCSCCSCRARKSNAGRGHGPPPANARRQETLRPAQTYSRAGVRHHQVRARIPSVSAARAGQSQRRVESRDYGLELEADVRAEGCMKARRRSPFRAMRDLIPCRQTLVRQAARTMDLFIALSIVLLSSPPKI